MIVRGVETKFREDKFILENDLNVSPIYANLRYVDFLLQSSTFLRINIEKLFTEMISRRSTVTSSVKPCFGSNSVFRPF